MGDFTQEELGRLKVWVHTVVEAAAPAIMHAIAASRPGTTVLGDRMHTEPLRDYRKELWSGIYVVSAQHGRIEATARADHAVSTFDERFPQ